MDGEREGEEAGEQYELHRAAFPCLADCVRHARTLAADSRSADQSLSKLWSLCSGVEREIELEYVDARLAEHPELAPFRVFVHELAQPTLGNASGFRNSFNLVLRGGRGDVRIEPRGRSGDQVPRHRGLSAEVLDATFYRLRQGGVGRSLVRARGGGAVVGHGRGRGRAAPEGLRVGERLGDEARCPAFAALHGQAALRPLLETALL